MEKSKDELKKMHWKERYAYEADLEYKRYLKKSETDLLKKIKSDSVGQYFQIWRALAKIGTLENSALVLWEFLKNTPGDNRMHDRYHCSNALFTIIGMPDPASKGSLRPLVQWDSKGEDTRQDALLELKKIIDDKLSSGK